MLEKAALYSQMSEYVLSNWYWIFYPESWEEGYWRRHIFPNFSFLPVCQLKNHCDSSTIKN